MVEKQHFDRWKFKTIIRLKENSYFQGKNTQGNRDTSRQILYGSPYLFYTREDYSYTLMNLDTAGDPETGEEVFHLQREENIDKPLQILSIYTGMSLPLQ